jgi:cold shock CspA family protein
MARATIVKWFDDRGFGFAKPDAAGSVDLFVHASDFPDDVRHTLHEGMIIHCDAAIGDAAKRPRAVNVSVIDK